MIEQQLMLIESILKQFNILTVQKEEQQQNKNEAQQLNKNEVQQNRRKTAVPGV